MADNWTQNVGCRYFRNTSGCREGDCGFRHWQGNRNDASTNEATSTNHHSHTHHHTHQAHVATCRFFKQGSCKFGAQCRFSHDLNNTDNNATQTNGRDYSYLEHLNKPHGKSKYNAEWVKAPEFVPNKYKDPVIVVPASTATASAAVSSTSGTSPSTSTPVSYAQAVNPHIQQNLPISTQPLDSLCPYAEAIGNCLLRNCPWIHGDICELCSRPALHPHNEELRKKHTNACMKQHEADMELSFAIQRSKEKSCGVCFETIMEKSSREQRFGILPNCNHCFCLTCIRKWRQAKQFDNKIIRACPECRIPSDFVCPSMYWVDTKEEKEKLIKDYKGALSTKDCKYFNKGRGKCPFGNKCFYLHALPDGTKKDVGPPVRQRRNNADADYDILHQLILWDFFDERDDRWMYLDLEDIPFFSDSDDSDWSDYELSFD
ncbi:hypothetical protein PUN28_010763 [Cardiocondyla obscurior]|uniref:RING-type E3 ubiquitin transferase n=1 Tax=Cardiocondyla obscurior TaxID=286306 RepID=A0AAW2FHL3_9HYME